MTAKDFTDGVLGEIAAAVATAAWNIANFVLDRCELTHTKADLQGFEAFGDGAKPMYASNFGPVSNGRPPNAEVASTQSRRLPKENANLRQEVDCQTELRTNKRAKVSKWTISEAAAAALPKIRSSACQSLTMFSTAAAATWTSAADATSTSPMMSSSSSTIPFYSNLASLIYYIFILDHLNSNTNFKFNLHQDIFRKFYYLQLISFLDNALSAQPISYKSLESIISFALHFV